MRTYSASAVPWEHGWELHIDGVGVTQSRTLAAAERMVRDYLTLDGAPDADTASVTILPNLHGLEIRAGAVRVRTEEARAAQLAAARAAREVAADLRKAGLSVADTATVMGVSKGRVSQLTHTAGRF